MDSVASMVAAATLSQPLMTVATTTLSQVSTLVVGALSQLSTIDDGSGPEDYDDASSIV
jgi:hypothetical protein